MKNFSPSAFSIKRTRNDKIRKNEEKKIELERKSEREGVWRHKVRDRIWSFCIHWARCVFPHVVTKTVKRECLSSAR